jgi:hypothetical protein
MRPQSGLFVWLREHVRGVNTVLVLAGLFIGGSAMKDPVAGVNGWGPEWIGPAIIIGSIGGAWSIWRFTRNEWRTSGDARPLSHREMGTSRGVEFCRARIAFSMTESEMLTGSIQVFLEQDSEWRFNSSIYLRTSYMPGIIHEAQLVSMSKNGEKPEVVNIDIPVSELASYVDRQLKPTGWRRISDLNSWAATEPSIPGETPNRAAECDLRRGWNERQYLKRIDAARAARRRERTRG